MFCNTFVPSFFSINIALLNFKSLSQKLNIMQKLIYIFCIVIFLCSCEKEDRYGPDFIDIQIEIKLLDQSGKNLLNPSNPNAYDAKDIKLYYLEGGNLKEVNYANYDYPRNFMILNEPDYRIRLFPNTSKNEEFPLTFIKWNESDIDTIKCEFSAVNSSVICRKVWYNEKLMWDNFGVERFFEIVK